METLSSSVTIVASPSSFSAFSPNSQKQSCRRLVRFSMSPKSNGNGGDSDSLRSDAGDAKIVPIMSNQFMSQDAAMGLVLSAASVRGWTTGSGMEGPPVPAGVEEGSGTEKRTTRAINPHAYTEGTVFVQCCGCQIFHKLVDNLNLFHEMKCYVNPSFNYSDPNWNMTFKFLDVDDDQNDGFSV
ncbi:unnamed protein product [Rhodiola kirilowii]